MRNNTIQKQNTENECDALRTQVLMKPRVTKAELESFINTCMPNAHIDVRTTTIAKLKNAIKAKQNKTKDQVFQNALKAPLPEGDDGCRKPLQRPGTLLRMVKKRRLDHAGTQDVDSMINLLLDHAVLEGVSYIVSKLVSSAVSLVQEHAGMVTRAAHDVGILATNVPDLSTKFACIYIRPYHLAVHLVPDTTNINTKTNIQNSIDLKSALELLKKVDLGHNKKFRPINTKVKVPKSATHWYCTPGTAHTFCIALAYAIHQVSILALKTYECHGIGYTLGKMRFLSGELIDKFMQSIAMHGKRNKRENDSLQLELSVLGEHDKNTRNGNEMMKMKVMKGNTSTFDYDDFNDRVQLAIKLLHNVQYSEKDATIKSQFASYEASLRKMHAQITIAHESDDANDHKGILQVLPDKEKLARLYAWSRECIQITWHIIFAKEQTQESDKTLNLAHVQQIRSSIAHVYSLILASMRNSSTPEYFKMVERSMKSLRTEYAQFARSHHDVVLD